VRRASAQERDGCSLASNGRAREVNRSRNWGVEVGETIVDEVRISDRGTIGVRDVSGGSMRGIAVNSWENDANLSHENSEGNINNIISRSSSVGVASEISSNDSQGIL